VDQSLVSINSEKLMHLCDAKLGSMPAVAQSGGAGTSSAFSVKLIVSIIICAVVAVGAGVAFHFSSNDEPLPEPPKSVAVEVVEPNATIDFIGSDADLPEGVNPSSASLITDIGEATSWSITTEDDATVSSGLGENVDFNQESLLLTPGRYFIVWQITGDTWESTAKREFVII
jgi:hypothetical protein